MVLFMFAHFQFGGVGESEELVAAQGKRVCTDSLPLLWLLMVCCCCYFLSNLVAQDSRVETRLERKRERLSLYSEKVDIMRVRTR